MEGNETNEVELGGQTDAPPPPTTTTSVACLAQVLGETYTVSQLLDVKVAFVVLLSELVVLPKHFEQVFVQT